jgi:hypothetical protein
VTKKKIWHWHQDGCSVKIRVTYSVPESHLFDPVSVEFGLAFMKLGNGDRNFLLQGKTELALVFVNKGWLAQGPF